jgi:hypothetical protein
MAGDQKRWWSISLSTDYYVAQSTVHHVRSGTI